MTQEQVLWRREERFWHPWEASIDDRQLTREGEVAVLSYRVTGPSSVLLCGSTYTRAAGTWMLLEHRQSSS